jgi:hypothetical protein
LFVYTTQTLQTTSVILKKFSLVKSKFYKITEKITHTFFDLVTVYKVNIISMSIVFSSFFANLGGWGKLNIKKKQTYLSNTVVSHIRISHIKQVSERNDII